MYNSQKAKSIKTTTKVVTVGINDNCKYVTGEVKTSQNGNPFFEIIFENAEGVKVTQTEWKPTRFDGMTDEDYQAKYDTQYSRMLHILECFYKEEELNFNGESFTEFANWVIDLLNKVDKETLLRIKFVYNNRGFVTLPSYAKFQFIERMDTPKSNIKILDKDQLIRPVVADTEVKVNTDYLATPGTSLGSSENTTSTTQVNSDLPF